MTKFLKILFLIFTTFTTVQAAEYSYVVVRSDITNPIVLNVGQNGEVVTSLSNLTDVTLGTPLQNDVLTYNNGKWSNGVASAGLTVSNVMPLRIDLTGYDFGTGASNSAMYGRDTGIGTISGAGGSTAVQDIKPFGFYTGSTNRDQCYGTFETIIPIGITNAISLQWAVFQTQTNTEPVYWRLADGINSCNISNVVTVANQWQTNTITLPAGANLWIREHKLIYFRGLFSAGSLTNGVPRYTLFTPPAIVQ